MVGEASSLSEDYYLAERRFHRLHPQSAALPAPLGPQLTAHPFPGRHMSGYPIPGRRRKHPAVAGLLRRDKRVDAQPVETFDRLPAQRQYLIEQVQLVQDVGDEVRQMVLRQPLLQYSRQQQLLVRVIGTVALAHRRLYDIELCLLYSRPLKHQYPLNSVHTSRRLSANRRTGRNAQRPVARRLRPFSTARRRPLVRTRSAFVSSICPRSARYCLKPRRRSRT